MKPTQLIDNKGLIAVDQNPGVWIHTIMRRNGVSCSDVQLEQLQRFAELLLEWNKKVNLVSRRDIENLWESHILHSLAPILMFKVSTHAAMLDLGSGGGLPGIPLKIMLPTVSMTMLDATKKKVVAVQSMIQELRLSGAEAVWGRAEDLARDKRLVGRFDHVIARGVAPLRDLVALARPFLRGRSPSTKSEHSGRGTLLPPETLIAYKGGDLEDEVRRARIVAQSLEMVDIVFEGSEQLPGPEKKLVIARFES